MLRNSVPPEVSNELRRNKICLQGMDMHVVHDYICFNKCIL